MDRGIGPEILGEHHNLRKASQTQIRHSLDEKSWTGRRTTPGKLGNRHERTGRPIRQRIGCAIHPPGLNLPDLAGNGRRRQEDGLAIGSVVARSPQGCKLQAKPHFHFRGASGKRSSAQAVKIHDVLERIPVHLENRGIDERRGRGIAPTSVTIL